MTFIFFRGVGQPPTREYLKWEAPSTQDINAYQNQDMIVGIAENQIQTPKKQLVGEGALVIAGSFIQLEILNVQHLFNPRSSVQNK